MYYLNIYKKDNFKLKINYKIKNQRSKKQSININSKLIVNIKELITKGKV